MKVVSWNVNSVRQRLPRLLAFLKRHEPDVVCLQETKVEDVGFPAQEIATAGYELATFGQRAYNGVAVLSRSPLTEVVHGFDGDPVPGESRVLSAEVGNVLRVVSVYIVNGKEVGDPAYDIKLRWLKALREWLAASFDPGQPLVVTGDFNIAPDDRDVYDSNVWHDRNLVSPPERERLRAMLEWGLVDLSRQAAGDVPGPFTFWDYRSGAFHKGWGLRIDLALGTQVIADRLISVEVDREERKASTGEGKPSDHAPLIVTLRD